jgi:hypothetical protein
MTNLQKNTDWKLCRDSCKIFSEVKTLSRFLQNFQSEIVREIRASIENMGILAPARKR